jgi:hypothetical protein
MSKAIRSNIEVRDTAIGIYSQGPPQPVHLVTITDIAITQMRSLLTSGSVKRLK